MAGGRKALQAGKQISNPKLQIPNIFEFSILSIVIYLACLPAGRDLEIRI